ncbi:hypothetical protein BD769DRAFT_1376537, partial [Suillus cothurnatus]
LSPSLGAPSRLCFEKFIDAIIDLLIPGTPEADLYGKPEFLFFGPGEGTTNMVGWMALRARDRDAET